MAATMALQCGRNLLSLRHAWLRYSSHSTTGPAPDPQKVPTLRYLHERFYDIEYLIEIGLRWEGSKVESKNRSLNIFMQKYGDNMAAVIFALFLKGGIRFEGQTEWYREHERIQFYEDLRNFQGVPVEALDFSGSIFSNDGLECLIKLKSLKHLDLSRCPYVNDWSLSRLHHFKETLEELSLAGCPQVTERGLGCLHHLENLRRLDVSDLPSVSNKGLVQILLEEMLPQCEVIGTHYEDDLAALIEPDTPQDQTEKA